MGPSDRSGSVLAGKFRLERPLGRGASAVVWEASHVLTGRTVALKLFDPTASSRGRERWLREARAASRVRHPNLLPIDDVIELGDGRAVLIMERLFGRSLRERLASGPLGAEEVVALFASVAEALGQAHAAGIVHRDLKPDNLFLTAEPRRLVVLDFGVAKLASDGDLGLTSTGATVGTPFYMAPEQLFGEDDVDGRADAWALGVVLHECLAGRRPIEAANLGQLLKKMHEGAMAPLDPAVAPDHPALVSLVARLLTVDRDARATIDEATAVLSGVEARGIVAARAQGDGGGQGMSGSSGQVQGPERPEAPGGRAGRWSDLSGGSGRRRGPWMAAGLAAIVGAGAVVMGGVRSPARGEALAGVGGTPSGAASMGLQAGGDRGREGAAGSGSGGAARSESGGAVGSESGGAASQVTASHGVVSQVAVSQALTAIVVAPGSAASGRGVAARGGAERGGQGGQGASRAGGEPGATGQPVDQAPPRIVEQPPF